MKRAVIFLHRWLGVALCAIFLLWFPSGIGMMYWGYPTVTPADRLDRSPALDPATVLLTPEEAYATLGYEGSPDHVVLNTFDGRPVYRFGSFRGADVVFADTGGRLDAISAETAGRMASAWTGQPLADATVARVEEVDQWTLQTPLASLWPVWKYSWSDGQQVYVSQSTGEVVQYTTTASRIGAYLGPIPHWFYFTPLRRHGPEWSRVVIWSSGIGTIAAILGVVAGLWMYSPRKVYRYNGAPARLPYYGQKRWHAVLGLVFGVATATWAFSGMLSMDPFPSRTGGDSAARGSVEDTVRDALRDDVPFEAFTTTHPAAALAQIDGAVKQLELTSLAGEPAYLATIGRGDTRVVPLEGEPRTEVARQRIVDVLTGAAGPGDVVDDGVF